MDAQAIAKRLPCKHSCTLRRHGKTEVKFGLTTVLLPSRPDKPLTLVVVRHGKREPMVLISTRRAYGCRQGQMMSSVALFMHRPPECMSGQSCKQYLRPTHRVINHSLVFLSPATLARC